MHIQASLHLRGISVHLLTEDATQCHQGIVLHIQVRHVHINEKGLAAGLRIGALGNLEKTIGALDHNVPIASSPIQRANTLASALSIELADCSGLLMFPT